MKFLKLLLLSLCFITPITVFAQSTVTATMGDTRTVVEPSFPTSSSQICATYHATKYSKVTNTLNNAPFNTTCTGGAGAGKVGCTGGTDFQPSSSNVSFTEDETSDTAALQALLNSSSCIGSNKYIEVSMDSAIPPHNALVVGNTIIKTAERFLIDAGVHIYASITATDYNAGSSCGTISTSGITSCGGSTSGHWIRADNTNNSGIYGYGILDGRGWTILNGKTDSFYSQRQRTYCTVWGTNKFGTPTCPTTLGACSASGNHCETYGPNGLDLDSAANFTIYKTTIMNAAQFQVNWEANPTAGSGSVSGLTVWDGKIIAPFDVSNTDGLDPVDGTLVTVKNSFISSGDNVIAVKAKKNPAGLMTFNNLQAGAGIGYAIGYDQQNGISDILIENSNERGNLNGSLNTGGSEPSHAVGILVNTGSGQGGTVQRVTYKNLCIEDEYDTIWMDEIGGGYKNFLFQNIGVLPASQAGFTTGGSGYFTFKGDSTSDQITLEMDNFKLTGTPAGTGSATSYTTAYFGPGDVTSSLRGYIPNSGTNLSVNNTSASTTYCTTSSWQALTGELNLYTPALHNMSSATTTGPIKLQVVLQPTTAISTKEAQWPTGSVNFYDNGTLLGSYQVGLTTAYGDGTYAEWPITTVTTGTHVYTATYPGDANYSSFNIGSSVTVVSGVATVAPVITFAVSNHTYGDSPFAVSATSTSTGAITYSVVSGPATISGSTVTLTGSGTVVLMASQAAVTGYSTGTQNATFTVNASGVPAITFVVANHTYGGSPFTVSATSNSAGAFTYSVVSGPATIAGSTVTLTGAGTVVLMASEAANGIYSSGTLNATFTAAASPPTTIHIILGGTMKLGGRNLTP